jgi:hypothetical protein
MLLSNASVSPARLNHTNPSCHAAAFSPPQTFAATNSSTWRRPAGAVIFESARSDAKPRRVGTTLESAFRLYDALIFRLPSSARFPMPSRPSFD